MRQTFPELAVIDVRTAHLWRALETGNEQFDHRGQPFFGVIQLQGWRCQPILGSRKRTVFSTLPSLMPTPPTGLS
jgi:hypothetical protein